MLTDANDTTMTVLFSAYNGGTFTAVVSPRENGALVKVSSENDDETQYMQHVKQFFQDVDAQLNIRAVAQKSEAPSLSRTSRCCLSALIACDGDIRHHRHRVHDLGRKFSRLD